MIASISHLQHHLHVAPPVDGLIPTGDKQEHHYH